MARRPLSLVTKLIAGGLLAGLPLLAPAIGVLAPASPALAQSGEQKIAGVAVKVGDTVTLTLADGRTITGEVTAVTGNQIKVKSKVAGIAAETSYNASEIKSLTVGAAQPATAPATTPSGTPRPDAPANPNTTAPATEPKDDQAQGPSVYFVPIVGEFGRDCAATPMRETIRDARKFQPDFLIFVFDSEFAFRREESNELDLSQAELAWQGGLEAALNMAEIIQDEIRDDPKWVKKPTPVAWVRRGMGPTAFLIMSFKNIYMSSGTKIGGIGYLNLLMAGVGDVTVQEKQRSLRFGRAAGLFDKGGHDLKLLRAMARSEYELSFSMVNGKPAFFENLTGDEVLTDNGDPQEGKADLLSDAIRGRGNDVLNITPEVALKLGVSKGTVNSREELFYALGIERQVRDLSKDAKAAKIQSEWSRGVGEAEAEINRLLAELQRTPVQGATATERNAVRGRRIGMLNKIKSTYEAYKESVDPNRFGSSSNKELVVQSNIQIDMLKQQIRLDRD